MLDKKDFKKNDYVIYPTHGLGKVMDIVKQSFGDQELELLVIEFEKNRMLLRVPVNKIEISGLRKVSTEKDLKKAVDVVKTPPKVKRMMWSRRAAEYEEKINSGDPVALAEVVRDLHSRTARPEQSFSERQIYEQALGRLADEFGAVHGLPSDESVDKLEKIMDKHEKKVADKLAESEAGEGVAISEKELDALLDKVEE